MSINKLKPKILLSNLAWHQSEEADLLPFFASSSLRAIEIAPTMIWSDLYQVKKQELIDYKMRWADWGIEILSAQAILFGKEHLQPFKSKKDADNTIEYIGHVFELLAELGVTNTVFGSPKVRKLNGLDQTHIYEILNYFFEKLAQAAKKHSLVVSIEPAAKQYGAEFLNTSVEVLNLLKSLDHKSLKINLDVGNAMLEGENLELLLPGNHSWIGQAQISRPFLEPIVESLNLMDELLVKSIGSYSVSIEYLAKAGEKFDKRNFVRILSQIKAIHPDL